MNEALWFASSDSRTFESFMNVVNYSFSIVVVNFLKKGPAVVTPTKEISPSVYSSLTESRVQNKNMINEIFSTEEINSSFLKFPGNS